MHTLITVQWVCTNINEFCDDFAEACETGQLDFVGHGLTLSLLAQKTLQRHKSQQNGNGPGCFLVSPQS